MMASPLQTKIHFRKLHPSGSEVRLLELQPAHDISDTVVCRLVNIALAPDVEFIGLSVLYGDSNTTEQICLNERRISVPATLAQALRNVRAVVFDAVEVKDAASEEQRFTPTAKKTPRWLSRLLKGVQSILLDSNPRSDLQTPLRLWVDALCVNQSDAREQSQRRAHMAMVYRSARMVVGWLGEKDETSDYAVKIIRTVDKCMPDNFGDPEDKTQHPENYAPQYKWMTEMKWLWDVPPDIRDPTQFPAFVAAQAFFSRPYLQRDWILEEIAMATFPAFLVGDEILSWMQVLRWNRCNEELMDNATAIFPEGFRSLIQFMPLGAIYTLLKDFERRRRTGSDTSTNPVPGSSSVSTKSR
ncbi:heterokaryon incompatibility protein-domain-containing protein [Truncatella angustata]|uniref:Heterokaryon incompatibility protein-domain-containing protein n=1 Tax=Truncatella angustata TaxID=152316 RepID=A0A9P9A3P8_9PEZI|nr:heterokaryon incompatibility protein-domain-containing protein [Truncatella angustata]KAH6659134.1 heterokaryon incompatibility protein-domain-containing protein [Truncatella angustata]